MIEAHIDADNTASLGVASRNGFIRVGEVAEETWSGGTVTRLRLVRPARLTAE